MKTAWWAYWLLAAVAGAGAAELTFPRLEHEPGRAGIRVEGAPGDYEIQATTNLEFGWKGETNLVIGAEGYAETDVPFSGRSYLCFRAVGTQTPTGGVPQVRLSTSGAAFSPELGIDAGLLSAMHWAWSDGTTSTNHPEAEKPFGMAGAREQALFVDPAAALTSINLGFDGSDGGESTPLPHRAPQGVTSVQFDQPPTGLRYFAASYNLLTNMLDFRGAVQLEAVECFQASTLQHVVLTNLPSLKRVCLEDADLQELDLSGNPGLEDLRGALNGYTEIRVERGTGPAIWHWCTRDNPQITQSFQDVMTNFFALRELFIWRDNQSGHLSLVSTNLESLVASGNRYESFDLTGKDRMIHCDLADNRLTNAAIGGCVSLRELYLQGNRLGTEQIDGILAFLDESAPMVANVDLHQNAELPSGAGYAHCSNLIARGVAVSVDWPDTTDGATNAAGGADCITFVTDSRQPHMEIQTGNGTPTNLVWHWGDGRITRGVRLADHDFGAEGVWTNYVQVQPASCATYFGARIGAVYQGIRAVRGASNFPALSFLYLFQESLEELDLSGCANLVQLHLAGNPASTETCDQWFIDLDAAVVGSVSNADFFYPPVRSAASDAAWSNLVGKGYAMHPM